MSRCLTFPLLFASLLAVATTVASLASSPAAARAYSGADREVPLARFQDPLCPGIVGVAQDSAEGMVELIRRNAAELGLRLAEPQSCEPNLLVLVIDDPRGYLAGLRERKPYLFEHLGAAERQALFDAPGPAHTWTRVFVRTRDGMEVYQSENLTEPTQMWVEAAHSLIYVPTRRDIVSSMVLIDKKAVQGMSVAQIADYATMRGLSGSQAERLGAPRETILDLFEATAGAKPAGLTRSDRIFLQTLYSTMPNNPAAITLSMADARIAGDKPAE